jgi:hypothetical protein
MLQSTMILRVQHTWFVKIYTEYTQVYIISYSISSEWQDMYIKYFLDVVVLLHVIEVIYLISLDIRNVKRFGKYILYYM